VIDAGGHGIGSAAEGDELEGLSAGEKSRCQLGHIPANTGRGRAERAAVEAYFELTHETQDSKLKIQN
jgi:hypothetical protein